MKKKIIDEGFLSLLEGRDLQIRRSMQGLFGGTRPSPFFGSSAEFAEYREYVPGDDLRRVDTNLLARFDKLYTKQFVDERQLHHRIYVDASRSMDWGTPNKGHLALKLCAALGYVAVRNCDRVSFFALRNRSCQDIATSISGKEAFYRGADGLNGVKFYGDFYPADAICQREDMGKSDGLAVLISDFLNDGWQDVANYLCNRKKQVQFIQILSRDECAPELHGKYFLLDSEGEGEEDDRNMKIRINRPRIKAYHDAFNYHQKELEAFCAEREIGFLTLCSDEAIEKILFLKATEGQVLK